MKCKPKLSSKVGNSLKKAAPTILTFIGAAGVVGTSILAVKATPKALEKVREDSKKNHNGDPHAATVREAVKSGWAYYIPAASVGAVTIFCIFSANILNRRQQASLAAAYTLVSREFNQYKGKVKEIYGQEAHETIMRFIHAEKTDKPHIYATGFVDTHSLEFQNANEELRLFYDCFSARYFQATISQVLEAEYHLNRNFMLCGGEIGVNEFYELLGMEKLPEFADFGWSVNDEFQWLDFNHVETTIDDGPDHDPIQCYMIEMVFVPTNTPLD